MNPAASISLTKASRPAFERIWPLSAVGVFLPTVLFLAFATRLGVRLYFGEEYFWRNSYSLFYQIAERLATVHELSYEWFGTKYAHRPPVYPALLAATMIFGKSYVVIVILQSLIGAGTVLCSYIIGKELFNKTVGRLAAIGVAFYPYFVMHDTALQETGVFTFLTTVTILLLFKSRQSSSRFVWFIAGIVLGLAVMTRTTLIVFVPIALLWLLLLAGLKKREAFPRAAVVALGFTLIVSPWLLRNYLRTGTPTLSTLSGLTLWAGNNPYTFSNYPNGSIDRSVEKASQRLTAEEQLAIKQLSNDEVRQNKWFINKALDYINAHPGETFKRAFLKLGAAFSWKLNPAREGFVQTVYFLSYFSALLLGIVGAWLARKRWRELSLIYGLFISFAIVTAIFFAHTSHRVFLDVYLLIFSAYAVTQIYQSATLRRASKRA